MQIILNNRTCKYIIGGKDHLLDVDLDTAIRDYLTVKADGYQHVPAYKNGHWDGNIKHVNKNCEFSTGFLEKVIYKCESLGAAVLVKDLRNNPVIIKDTFINTVGNNEEWDLRDYQERVVKNTLSKIVGGHPFIRGMWYLEPDSGKTSMMVGLMRNLDNLKALVIIDRKANYTQTHKFLSEMFDIGQISGKKLELDKPVTIGMVKTINNQLKKSEETRDFLSGVNLIICDEAHRAASDTYKSIFGQADCYSIILMSGTLLDISSKPKKLTLFGLSGMVLDRVTGKDIVGYGVSLKPIVTIHPNKAECYDGFDDMSYREKYQKVIIESKMRLDHIINEFLSDTNQIMVIAVQYKAHAEYLHDKIDQHFNGAVRVAFSHSEDEYRDQKLQDLKDREISIFISTSILQESINIPCITTIVYALAGKSKVSMKQWKGRGSRLDKSNAELTHLRMIDFWDIGFDDQSRFRINTYKKEGYDLEIKYKHNRFFTPKFGF